MRDRLLSLGLFGLLARVGLFTGLGCNNPPKDPPRDGAETIPLVAVDAAPPAPPAPPASPASSASATTKPPVSASAASSAPRPAAASCSSDADCRTYASYCAEAPCACRVLSKSEGDPKCLGTGQGVKCFANPCMKKAARCQAGACVLTAQGAATD